MKRRGASRESVDDREQEAVTFEQLFDEVYPQLYRYSLRMSGDGDLAEDAAQEAFVRLLDREVTGEPSRLRAWLFTVTTHLLRDRARLTNNRARLLEENPVRPTPLPSPAEEVERQSNVEQVRRALDTLSERDRTLLLLKEEGFSYQEIAEEISVQPGSVGTLLARARKRLVAALNGEME